MVALGGYTILNFPKYLTKLSEETRELTLNRLRAPLRMIISDWGVIGWLVSHWQYLTFKQVRFITFLEKQSRRFSLEKLQASRVCAIEEDQSTFDIFAEMLSETSMRDVFQRNLANFPTQSAVSEEEFGRIVSELI